VCEIYRAAHTVVVAILLLLLLGIIIIIAIISTAPHPLRARPSMCIIRQSIRGEGKTSEKKILRPREKPLRVLGTGRRRAMRQKNG